MIEAKRRRVIATVPAAVPTAIASVGEMSNAITASVASATPRKIAGKTAPPRNPHPEAHGERQRLGREEHEHDPARILRDQVRDRLLPGEEHVLRARSETVGEQRQDPDGEGSTE